MKKQINPTTKAYLIQSAFYVLLLLAVCAIPFALAQRNTTKRAVTKPKVATARAATSRLPDDAAPATKGKAKVPSTRFSNLFGARSSRPTGVGCFYDFTVGTDTFVPGVDDIGVSCDDCGADIPLPFPVSLYGQTFTTAHVGSNGHVTFGTFNDNFAITCPPPFGIAGTTEVLAPYWTDQLTDGVGGGVFTTTTGSPGSQIFYIEWRSTYFGSPDALNYEVALHEDGDPPFEYIYNTINSASTGNDSQLVVGQKFDESCSGESCFTVFGCDTTGGTAPPVASGQALFAISAPTPTPTPTPACSPIVVNGVIDSSDPTQTDRLFRDGIASTCAVPKVCPGLLGDGLPRHYDSYTFTNNSGATQCVTVDVDAMTCTGANFIFLQAYVGSFDPTNLCTNYLADIGGSPDPTGCFSFNLDNGQTVVIVVNEVDPDAGCVGYSMTITNLCGGGGPTPTPTVTPTPTPSGTPSPTPSPTPRVTPRPRPTPHPRP
jgi:hypothetical protein